MRRLLKEFARHILPYRFQRLLRQTAKRVVPSLIIDKNEEEMIRMRTNDELDLLAKGLKEVRDILNTHEIPYYIVGGALLGAIRDGDFIKWDWDVDIETKMEDILPKQDQLILALKNDEFKIYLHNTSWTDFKIIAQKYGATYEIFGYLKMGGMRYRRRSFHSDYPGGGEIILRGEKYSTFQQPERYLKWIYGNWETPIRAVNDYFPINSRTSPINLTLIELVSLCRYLKRKLAAARL